MSAVRRHQLLHHRLLSWSYQKCQQFKSILISLIIFIGKWCNLINAHCLIEISATRSMLIKPRNSTFYIFNSLYNGRTRFDLSNYQITTAVICPAEYQTAPVFASRNLILEKHCVLMYCILFLVKSHVLGSTSDIPSARWHQ